jgi:CubicO group peptidase (beta-lactamase class C family)
MIARSVSRRDVLSLGLALGLSGCAPFGRQATQRTDSFNWTPVPPEDVGMTSAGLGAVRAAIQKYIDANQITGAVTAVARHNKLVLFEALGVRDTHTSAPLRKDDLFRMMSSTKQVTAVAVLMMLDEGKLSLDDKVSRFIPEFTNTKVAVAPKDATQASQVELVPADREITIRDLLTHTSGLSSTPGGLGPGPASLINKIERKPDDTLADYIPRLGAAALDFQPGTKWGYSPLDGFDTLLRIVEITSGQPAQSFLRERLFEPLDMRDTYFNVPADKQARVVTLYERKDGEWRQRAHLLGDGPYRYICGAGGLYSTVHDFLQFELMLLNKGTLNGKRLLKAETVALMSRNQVGSLFSEWIPAMTAGAGFGLGVSVVMDPERSRGRGVGAFGWGGAYGTESWADPELDVAAAVFVQQPVITLAPDYQRALREAIVS